MHYGHLSIAVALLTLMAAGLAQAQPAADLPQGVKAVWDLDKAFREATPTRERICINGLWRWQPARDAADTVPAGNWGYFKVPGCWPGITDYLQKDCQTVYPHPSWKGVDLRGLSVAWYQREITIPKEWAGRRITVQAEYLNSYAAVYLDGKKAGEILFPAGEADVTAACRPGQKHVLSLLVVALPLKSIMMSHNDTNAARQVKGSVPRRGLCGDVFLAGTPSGARLADVRVVTSVRKGEITFGAAPQGLAGDGPYILRAQITEKGRKVAEFTSKPFQGSALQNGRIAVTEAWKPARLWDIHTPQNQYDLQVSLADAGGRVLDTALPVRFGFRELWIDGRDFYLNGSRIFLSCVPLDNAKIGAAWSTYEAAKESLLRLKSFGINFVYTHNYGCEPGSHLGFEEILRACDDVGMLVSFSQPHFDDYVWETPDADQKNGYARHAEFYVRVAQNHPSIVFYSMSHNATGYSEDMNPDLIDGVHSDRSPRAAKNTRLALRAEAIVHGLDPSRIVYHHSSGNLSSMHTSNFYPNLVPIQEMSDWFEHWATTGVKPVFTCEYGAPFTWDLSMYRGWYQGKRSFGSARIPWEFCFAEWCAQFLGDRAFKLCDAEKKNIRWEARKFREGALWHRWDYPYEIGSNVFDDRHTVIGMYTADNWRAFRTWGMSINSPWEHGHFWRLRPGMNRNTLTPLKTEWEKLQRPGFSPDYIEDRYERMDMAYELKDWVPTADAQALIRNNMPLLAYIAGKPEAFTSKDHDFFPGETVEKQLIVINNSREPVSCECEWTLGGPVGAGLVPAPMGDAHKGRPYGGSKKVSVATGQQERIPLRFDLPADLPPGQYELRASVKFGDGETQKDSLTVDVLVRPAAPKVGAKIALFDPKGETAKLLDTMGVQAQPVKADADLAPYETLVIGKAALTADGPGPDLKRVRDGLRVIVFEQTGDALEKRLGFRVAEYGLRQVYPRVPDHPLLAGLTTEHLRDWRGAATVLPPRLDYTLSRRLNMVPAVTWCGIEVSRVWRCGNRGNVASVLIEKPAIGDFLPIVDGGYSLQYSPLMEYREGKGMVLFCQMDVTGRTESDPAAETLARNILSYVSGWKAAPRRTALYAGDPAGKAHLEAAGLSLGSYQGGSFAGQVLIVGPGGAKSAGSVSESLKGDGRVLAIGLDEREANAFSPKVQMRKAEHISAYFEPAAAGSQFAGIGPADVENRDPRDLPLVTGGATVVGDGVLAESGNVVFCQLIPWQFDTSEKVMNTRRTFRRASYLLTRLLGNLGVGAATPLLGRFSAPLGAGANAPTLLKNGDFQAGAGDAPGADWQFSCDAKDSTAMREKIVGEPGHWCVRLVCPGFGEQKNGTVMLAQQDVPVAKGQWYRISLRAKAEGMKDASVSLTIQNTTTWRSFFDYVEFTPGESWRPFSFTVEANATAKTGTKFQIWHGSAGTLWLADLRMEPCDAPTRGRWLTGLYLDQPVENDDPYRFFRW